ncbi:MAG: M28 family peptidase [Acidobacteria bacterium]|nr:M28 family peptidase [Acidobacteriota bacterium]
MHAQPPFPRVTLRRLFPALVLAACALAATVTIRIADPPAAGESVITPAELREHLAFLASDELGGRYTLSPSFNIAARYLASRLEAYGYKPAGDGGTYFQHFDLISSKPRPEDCAVTLIINGETSELKFGDFVVSSAHDGSAAGDIVFAGYGISAPAQKHDDYAGLNVKGKVVLLASGVPKGMDDAKLGPEEEGERAARAHGAVAVITLLSPRFSNALRSGQGRGFATRPRVTLARDAEGTLLAVALGAEAANKLLALAGTDAEKLASATKDGGALEPKALPAHADIKIAVEATRAPTQNVVAVLPGTDPKLKDEYVAFSAHYDHLQTNAQGKIYPGADDDGSGTTSVLAIARALAIHPPRRSVFVIFHAGEELGLLGSHYNTDYAPAVPLDRLVADLNIDMIGRSRPPGDNDEKDKNLTDANSVYLVGADRISRELNTISEATNQRFEKLNFNYLYNDPRNPERIYYRSDHWNYAKHGVPIIFYFDGTHVDYHQPTDTIDKIDFNKMSRIARLVYETGWQLLNMDHRPAIDQPATAP